MKFRVFLEKGAILPKKAHDTDSGFDLYSLHGGMIQPGERVMVDTGVHLELDRGYEGQVRSRSGLSCKQGVMVINSPGTIDAGYRGSIIATLVNLSYEPFTFAEGARIAQLVITQLPDVTLEDTEEFLNETPRGSGGHGSSGL